MSDEIWELLAKAIDAAAVRVSNLSYDECLAELAQIEEKFLCREDGNPKFMLETQRRVAENRVYAAALKRQGYDEIRRQFTRLRSLGFTDISQEYTYVSVIYRYYCEVGEIQESLSVLKAFHESLETNISAATFIKERIATAIAEVEASQ